MAADVMTKALGAVAFYLYREARRHNALHTLDYNYQYNVQPGGRSHILVEEPHQVQDYGGARSYLRSRTSSSTDWSRSYAHTLVAYPISVV